MCGFFGWVRTAGELGADERARARAALDTLTHRGPDGSGEWAAGGVWLGHRRLKIIDLSDAAAQPFHHEDGRHVLVFNGEIYNYVELRAELEAAGQRFATRSDTEVLLKALLCCGKAVLPRLDGMFAFALYDREAGTVLMARDALGQKPLYYTQAGGDLLFGSELRAVLRARPQGWRLDRDAFARFLMLGYYAGEETPVTGIRKLPPGCLMEIGPAGARIERYWRSRPGRPVRPLAAKAVGEDEAVAEFERLFAASCRRAMRADVPYGVFLSGGIDSSLVAAFCVEAEPRLRSFSVAMAERDFDESDKARLMAGHLGITEHHVFIMDQDAIARALGGVLDSLDEPHGDPGFVNSYFLAQSCRPHLTVGLAGDGGDELFAGYAPFAGLKAVGPLAALPGPLLAGLKAAVELLPGNDTYLGLKFKARAYLQGFPASESARFPLWLSAVSPAELGRLLPWLDPRGLFAGVEDELTDMAGASRQQLLLHYYQRRFLAEFVCTHTDRAAMQFGLEVRAPFLSPELIDFANGLPDSLRIRDGSLKWLLKRVAAKRGFPDGIIAQRKQGFTFPLARWLKGPLRSRMEEALDPAQWEDGLLDTAEMGRLMQGHLTGRVNNYRILYNLMVFRAWRRNHPQVGIG
jgi:asparagine synthase (glutamine-hydrolysing)